MDLSQFYDKPGKLDIRDFKEQGEELAKAIELAVKETQSVVVRSYPDTLILSVEQYDQLTPGLTHHEFEGQEFYLYQTPYNVMELEVREP